MKVQKTNKTILITTEASDGNMSILKGDKDGLSNRNKLYKTLKINPDRVISLRTTHKNKVYKATEENLGRGLENSDDAIKADAIVTNNKEIYLLIRTADCLPITVYDPKNDAIGLIHASKHNIDKIIKNTITKMKNDFNSNPSVLQVDSRPSIGPCHFEMDLRIIAVDELKRLGVHKIQISKICTFESKNYFSHRKAITQNKVDNYFATIFAMK